MLRRNHSYRFSLDVTSPSEAHRLSLDVISHETSYSSVNMSPDVVRRLLECNKSCGCSSVKGVMA